MVSIPIQTFIQLFFTLFVKAVQLNINFFSFVIFSFGRAVLSCLKALFLDYVCFSYINNYPKKNQFDVIFYETDVQAHISVIKVYSSSLKHTFAAIQKHYKPSKI